MSSVAVNIVISGTTQRNHLDAEPIEVFDDRCTQVIVYEWNHSTASLCKRNAVGGEFVFKVADAEAVVELVEPSAVVRFGIKKSNLFHVETSYSMIVYRLQKQWNLYLQVQFRQYFHPIKFHASYQREIITQEHNIQATS